MTDKAINIFSLEMFTFLNPLCQRVLRKYKKINNFICCVKIQNVCIQKYKLSSTFMPEIRCD